MATKRAVDIENLLVWAFREELPKGMPVSSTPWATIERYAAAGCVRIDMSSGPPSDHLGHVPGEPHPDAVLVGRAVAALAAEGPRALGAAEDCRALLADMPGLAEGVMAHALAWSFNLASFVIGHAVMGTRPTWDVGFPQPRRVQGSRGGNPVVEWTTREGETVTGEPPGHRYPAWSEPRCPLVWDDPSPRWVARQRAEYAVWHAALGLLVAQLEGTLADHEPIGPYAPAEPWLGGFVQPPKPRIFYVAPPQPKRAPPDLRTRVMAQRSRKRSLGG